MTVIAFVLGVLIIIPISGADMPVVISMLNSYSGWAAWASASLNNPLLIVAGSLVDVGRDPLYIMCKAMNRCSSVSSGRVQTAEGVRAPPSRSPSIGSAGVAFLLGNAEA